MNSPIRASTCCHRLTLCGYSVLSRSNTQVSTWVKGREVLIAYPRCHAPPPGLASGEPDDRLRRGIQYAAAFERNNGRVGVLDHPPQCALRTRRVMTGSVCRISSSRHRKSQRLAAAAHIDRREADRRKATGAAIALFGYLELALARAELFRTTPVQRPVLV